MEQTPKANRIHIGFFGRCNAGKSTLINMLTDQPVSLVSDVAGTTTDPVSKAMEILPLGPVVITDCLLYTSDANHRSASSFPFLSDELVWIPSPTLYLLNDIVYNKILRSIYFDIG